VELHLRPTAPPPGFHGSSTHQNVTFRGIVGYLSAHAVDEDAARVVQRVRGGAVALEQRADGPLQARPSTALISIINLSLRVVYPETRTPGGGERE
jgi:hypothetical protein